MSSMAGCFSDTNKRLASFAEVRPVTLGQSSRQPSDPGDCKKPEEPQDAVFVRVHLRRTVRLHVLA